MKMIKELEIQIRDLQRKLAEIQKDRAALRLQVCMGDSEIRKKDEKSDELDRRAKEIDEDLRAMIKKRQLLIFQSAAKGAHESAGSRDSS